MRLAAAGLSSALAPLAGCAREVGQKRGSTHYPTLNQPLTKVEDWYYMSIIGAYEADEAAYHLQIGGAASNALSLTVDDLRNHFDPTEEMITLACVGNPPGGQLRSSSYFRGVRMRDLIERAAVSTDVSGAYITGLDGFISYQDIDDLKSDSSMVAYEMGTSPDTMKRLPIDHGFPCRVFTPGKYGYMQPKWIDSINFVDQGGYGKVVSKSLPYFDGHMQLASGFSNPRSGTHPPQPLELLGFAFGDGRAIGKVELSIDGGAWQRAEIVYNDVEDDLPTHLWVLWRFVWDPPVGQHKIEVRATYVDGETQMRGMKFPYSGGSITSIELFIAEGA